jgi:F-type H+-transporting ATPase subunit epsilon
MSDNLLLEIVTPEDTVYSSQVNQVVLPSTEGEMGILPGHIPVLTTLKAGELAVTNEDGKGEMLAIGRGFAQVLGDKVSVVTEGAINIDEIDLSAVKEAQERAEKALADAVKQGMDPAEVEQLETVVRFSVAQRMAKERRRG